MIKTYTKKSKVPKNLAFFVMVKSVPVILRALSFLHFVPGEL